MHGHARACMLYELNYPCAPLMFWNGMACMGSTNQLPNQGCYSYSISKLGLRSNGA